MWRNHSDFQNHPGIWAHLSNYIKRGDDKVVRIPGISPRWSSPVLCSMAKPQSSNHIKAAKDYENGSMVLVKIRPLFSQVPGKHPFWPTARQYILDLRCVEQRRSKEQHVTIYSNDMPRPTSPRSWVWRQAPGGPASRQPKSTASNAARTIEVVPELIGPVNHGFILAWALGVHVGHAAQLLLKIFWRISNIF